MSNRILLLTLAAACSAVAFGCSSTDDAGGSQTRLTTECIDDPEQPIRPKPWVCEAPLTVECEDGGADPDVVFFLPPEGGPDTCEELEDEIDYELNNEGPFEVGTYDIIISPEGDPETVLCQTTLTVEDSEPPQAIEDPIELWPPNHKFHTIEGSDCVKDRCDGDDITVTFLYATSDEPVNAKGDGNTEPDIILECDRVKLRAERQGPSNGRVYRLGWTAVDQAGNRPKEIQECVVVVPHDQSGRETIEDEESYRVEHEKGECDDGTGGEGGTGGDGGASGGGGNGGDGGQGGVVVD